MDYLTKETPIPNPSPIASLWERGNTSPFSPSEAMGEESSIFPLSPRAFYEGRGGGGGGGGSKNLRCFYIFHGKTNTTLLINFKNLNFNHLAFSQFVRDFSNTFI